MDCVVVETSVMVGVSTGGPLESVGSGVLVRIAGVDFVWTAEHVVRRAKNELVVVFTSNGRLQIEAVPGRHVRDVFRSPSDDVAAIELAPDERHHWHRSRPFELPDVGDHLMLDSTARVMVVGAPGEKVDGPTWLSPRADGRPRFLEEGLAIPVVTRIVTDASAVSEDRFCILYEAGVLDDGTDEELEPQGYSGGAIIEVQDKRPCLLGLVSGSCKPAPLLDCRSVAPVLRLLLSQHRDVRVAAECEAALGRFSRARLTRR